MHWRDQVVRLTHGREEHAGKACKRNGHRCNRPRLDHSQHGPAVEKSEHGAERLAQVDVHATCLRHHRRQLPIAQRARDGQHPCDAPRDQQPTGRPDLPRNLRRDDKDARPDHHPGHNHDRVKQPQRLPKLRRRPIRSHRNSVDDLLSHTRILRATLPVAP